MWLPYSRASSCVRLKKRFFAQGHAVAKQVERTHRLLLPCSR